MHLAVLTLLNPLLPHRCLVCDQPLRDSFLCRHCRVDPETSTSLMRCPRCFSEVHIQLENHQECDTCRLLPLPLARQRYLWSYSGKARRLIVAMKFRPSRTLAKHCAKLAAAHLASLFEETSLWDMIVPMPSSPRNYRRRLFNPSREIASRLARSIELPCRSDLLYHRRFTSPQATQRGALRLSNAYRSIAVNRKFKGTPRILLIDDVVTSGSTSAVAAHLLRQQGAKSVDLLALARSPRWAATRNLVSQKLNY